MALTQFNLHYLPYKIFLKEIEPFRGSIRAETAIFHQFPPEIISSKLGKLLRYNII